MNCTSRTAALAKATIWSRVCNWSFRSSYGSPSWGTKGKLLVSNWPGLMNPVTRRSIPLTVSQASVQCPLGSVLPVSIGWPSSTPPVRVPVSRSPTRYEASWMTSFRST